MQACFGIFFHVSQKFAMRIDFQNMPDNPLIYAVFVHLLNQISDGVFFKPFEFLVIQAPNVFDSR